MSHLDNLRARWDRATSQMTAITERAAADNRDLNDAEQHNFDALRAELDELRPRIEQMVEVERSIDSTAGLFASISGQGRGELIRAEQPSIQALYRTPGEYLYDVFRSFGRDADPQARERLTRAAAYIQRDATTTINGATVQNMTLAEIAAIVPDVMVGGLWSTVDARRVIANEFLLREITSPVMFRPKVTQHTQVGPQGGAGKGKLGAGAAAAPNFGTAAVANGGDEKAGFVSRKMTLGRINVEPIAVGGTVDVSLWAEMLSPGVLNTIIDDLSEQYSIETEALSAAELVRAAGAAAGTEIDLAAANTAGAVSQKLIAAVYAASGRLYKAVGRLATVQAVSANVWAALASMVDGDGRPLFPISAPSNPAGSAGGAGSFSMNVAGLRTVVSPALPDDTMIPFAASGFELFERRLGVLQAIEPERAGRVVSYSGLVQALAIDDGAASAISVTAPAL